MLFLAIIAVYILLCLQFRSVKNGRDGLRVRQRRPFQEGNANFSDYELCRYKKETARETTAVLPNINALTTYTFVRRVTEEILIKNSSRMIVEESFAHSLVPQ